MNNDYFHLFIVSVFIFGLLIGSFLNVVIYRLPIILKQQWVRQAYDVLQEFDPGQLKDPNIELTQDKAEHFSLLYPPSHCPKCETPIKPWSNIPLISFLLQKGRCRHCKQTIPWRYPLVELLTACSFVTIALLFGMSYTFLGACIFTILLITMAFIDADTQYLPDILTLSLLWIGLLFNLNETFTPLPNAIKGVVVGYLSLWLLFQIYRLIRGVEGMGFGDFKLLSALGAWFGVSVLPLIILVSSIIGLLVMIPLQLIHKFKQDTENNQPIKFAFGPYLALSGWLVMVFNSQIMQFIHWWLALSGFSV